MLVSLANAADQRGVLRVGDRCSVALDGGHSQCVVALTNEDRDLPQYPKGKNWDFWYQATPKALYLTPLNRTMFAKGQAEEAGRAGCRAAVYKRNRVRLDTLEPGSHMLCSHRGRPAGGAEHRGHCQSGPGIVQLPAVGIIRLCPNRFWPRASIPICFRTWSLTIPTCSLDSPLFFDSELCLSECDLSGELVELFA